jgi:beta-phosphoglucomutase
MSEPLAASSLERDKELQAIYDGSADGILVVEIRSMRFVRANRAICRLLGYDEDELLSLSVGDIHPADEVPRALAFIRAMSERRLKCGRDVPCLRKDGGVIYADITASLISFHERPCLLAFFHDITEEKRAMEAIRASDERYRLIAENVADVIWTVEFSPAVLERAAAGGDLAAMVDAILEEWRFAFVSPAVERLFQYTPDEAKAMSLRDITTPATLAQVREVMIEEFGTDHTDAAEASRQRFIELELVAKGGVARWCEVATTYLRDERGMPTGALGITRDASRRRETERALRESEGKLRSLLENLPDLVLVLDRDANVLFVNHSRTKYSPETLLGNSGLAFVTPEYQAISRQTLDQALATGLPHSMEVQDVFGLWWLCRLVRLADENGAARVIGICTDVTEQRLATEGIKKEQQLLRRLLDIQEQERQLIAYEIHDGFAQQLTGALFRLQGFRETLSRDAAEAWKGFDSGVQLVCCAIGETRRLISGLRPPVLDEFGVVEAVQNLVYEQNRNGGPEVEFEHGMADGRLTPPLENAIFRVAQESLTNAVRHSRSDKIRVTLTRRDGRICIDVRDWGVGFDPDLVEKSRFGLQGIRERVRLLEGCMAIESAPGAGTRISVELPLNAADDALGVIFDMDGVLVDTYHAHYRSWLEMAEAEGFHFSEEEFASTFGRTSREIIAHFWGEGRLDDAQIAELDRRKEAAFRRMIESDFPAMPEVGGLLRSLHDAGFHLAVGSSGPAENVGMVLDRLDARDLFEAVVTGEDVSRGKPDPEVFLIAARRLGIPPARCAVIEDAPPGIAAANSAGMVSVGLLSTGRKPADLAAARIAVESLGDLSPQVLRELIAAQPSSTRQDKEAVA